MNSRFCVIWARINDFETRIMFKSQKSRTQDAKLVKTSDEKKSKMATEIIQILDSFDISWWAFKVLIFASDLEF